MESCKKLDFRGRDVSAEIPNHFNMVSDNFALGLQLSFSLFLFSVAEREPLRGLFPCIWVYHIYTHSHRFCMADRSHLFIPGSSQMRAGDLYLALRQEFTFSQGTCLALCCLRPQGPITHALELPGKPPEHIYVCSPKMLIMQVEVWVNKVG